MQLFVISWTFTNSEDQIYASEEFCNFLTQGKLNHNPEGFELLYAAHMPQDGTGIVICKAQSSEILYKIFNMWRDSYGILFEYKPALTNEDFLKVFKDEKNFWDQD